MRFILSVWITAASILLASCGGTSAPKTEIVVSLTDFQFSPNAFTVPTGKEITLHTSNSGAVLHNFMIMNLGRTAGPEFDQEDLPYVYWRLDIPPGGDSSTTFAAPDEPGDYEVVCSIPGHILAGMVGKLTVVESE